MASVRMGEGVAHVAHRLPGIRLLSAGWSALAIPRGSHIAPGEAFERNRSSGLYSPQFASRSVPANEDEFPGMVPVSSTPQRSW